MENNKVILTSKQKPSQQDIEKLEGFLLKKYGEKLEIQWSQDESIEEGFLLQVGDEEYDWTLEGKLAQLENEIDKIDLKSKDYISLLQATVNDFEVDKDAKEVGRVVAIGDGIAKVSGLEHATYGEVLIFTHGIRGMILDIQMDEIGCIIFGEDDDIYEGSPVYRSKKRAGILASDEILGRVVNALGDPIDSKGSIDAKDFCPIENTAPSIMKRKPVSRPLETGLLTIDSMFPIGRGQRELIIGDRQTGKTAIALDTILNQKDKDVICIYVAIGQKTSSVAQLHRQLESRGAMEYTTIVLASASESAAMQYISPYTGCAIGEYFMNKGKDVLIVYDDLSKHAIAYRSISLLLERSPGREAYPGDVFYLHSRLLERSAQLSDALGGGSMSSLPIVETQAGDVSAYIPTNIISITDGQIFLESDLFFAGQRPAVNVGLSVSRVGGAAQSKMVKKASSTIRLDLAQYREMEVFTQFASDLDDTTKRQLMYGKGLMQLLKQDQYSPLQDYEQTIILVVALEKLFMSYNENEIKEKSLEILEYIKSNDHSLIEVLKNTKDLSEQSKERIITLAKEFISQKM